MHIIGIIKVKIILSIKDGATDIFVPQLAMLTGESITEDGFVFVKEKLE